MDHGRLEVLTKCNHVTFTVDIADHVPGTANAGRHTGHSLVLRGVWIKCDPQPVRPISSSEAVSEKETCNVMVGVLSPLLLSPEDRVRMREELSSVQGCS